MDSKGYIECAPEVCVNFQVDLSCLVDVELDEGAAGRAVMHMEACDCCRGFFEDTRAQLKLHRDMSDPDRLFARFAILTGEEMAAQSEGISLVHRLASSFRAATAFCTASCQVWNASRVPSSIRCSNR